MSSQKLAPVISNGKTFHTLQEDSAFDKVTRFIQDYKTPILLAGVILLVLLVGIPVVKYFRQSRFDAMNTLFFNAKSGLKKEQFYRDIISQYADVPASALAYVKLGEFQADRGKIDDAIKTVDEALAKETQPIIATILILKKAGWLAEQKKFKEAQAYLVSEESKILPSFKARYKLIQADLLLESGDVEAASGVYQEVAEKLSLNSEVNEEFSESSVDPQVVQFAKDRMALIKLGLFAK